MNRADRLANFALFLLAAVAWAAVAFALTAYDPRGNAAALLAGAILLGTAISLTVAPVFWLAAFVRSRRIAYRGDWWRAGRRAALVGLVVALLVVMRGTDLFSVPLALFVIAMAALIELTLSLRG